MIGRGRGLAGAPPYMLGPPWQRSPIPEDWVGYRMCENCGSRLPPSAEFCPNCGEERAGYAVRHFARASAVSPASLLEGRVHPPASLVRLLASLAAAALATAPWLLPPAAAVRVPAALAAGLGILALGWRERETVATSLRGGTPSAWVVALCGAAAFLGLGFLGGSTLPAAIRPPSIPRSGLHPVAGALSLALLPAVLEGIAFRGLLLESLRRLLGTPAAHLLAAAGAAALYGRPEAFPHLLLFTLFLGYLRERGRSLLPPMAAHAVYNLGAIFLPGA